MLVRSLLLAGMALLSARVVTAQGAPAADPPFASEEYLRMYLPAETPYTHICRCARPDCPGFGNPGFLVWSRERPFEVSCKACGTWYPSAEFPEDHVLEVDGRAYTYHVDARGRPLFFTGLARYSRVMRALYDARYAANACAAGDLERGAQARAVLLRLAEVYRGYFYARTPTFDPGLPLFPDVPGNAGAGKLKQYFGDYALPSFFCDIYDPLAAAGLLDETQRAAVRALIEDSVGQCVFPYFRLYRATGNTAGAMLRDFVRAGISFPELSIRDLVHEYHFGAERVLRGPDLVHEVVEGEFGIGNLIANGFYPDGFWREGSLSYQAMVLAGLIPALEPLRGYSDPPGYVPADPDWQPLRDYRPESVTPLRRALLSLPLLAFPDGTALTIGDTHKGQDVVAGWQKTLGALAPAEGLTVPETSAFHDGIGVAALRCGSGSEATATFLTYGPRGGGHSHYDQLNLTFYALGHELATDIGYPDSTDPLRGRWWNRAAAHNTVVVDGRNQAQSMGRLEAFASAGRFTVAQASCDNAYPALEDYRRTVVLVGDPDDATAPRYVVDVFHVIGGATHDYAFHAQSEPDRPEAEFATDGLRLVADPAASLLELTPGAEPDTMGYDCVTDLRRGRADDPWSARWLMPEDNRLSLRLLALPGASEEVIVGSAPGHRLAPGQRVDIGKRMTWLCRRRAGQAPLHSSFVSVVQAEADGAPAPVAARLLACTGSPEGDAVAIEVAHGSGRDILVITRVGGIVEVPEIALTLEGRIGLLSLDGTGKVTGALLVDGGSLTIGDVTVQPDTPALRGAITALPDAVDVGPLVAEVDLPLTEAALGRLMTIEHANRTGSAWVIEGVEPIGGGARLTLDRSAHEGLGRVGELSEDGLTLYANSGFHQFEEGLSARYYDGAWLRVGARAVRLRALATHGRDAPYLYEAALRDPLPPDVPPRCRFGVSSVAPGDTAVVHSVATLMRATPEPDQ